jgi:hypothetical protein
MESDDPYRVQNSLPQVPPHVRLGLTNGLFPSDFPTKTFYCISHLSLTFGEEHKLRCSSWTYAILTNLYYFLIHM